MRQDQRQDDCQQDSDASGLGRGWHGAAVHVADDEALLLAEELLVDQVCGPTGKERRRAPSRGRRPFAGLLIQRSDVEELVCRGGVEALGCAGEPSGLATARPQHDPPPASSDLEVNGPIAPVPPSSVEP